MGILVEDSEEFTADELVDSYNWIWIGLKNPDDCFKASWWCDHNAGTEFQDFTYRPNDQWLFRHHRIATLFKLMFG